MISDKDLFIQIIEREVLNFYQNLSQKQPLLNIPLVENTVFGYADKVIEHYTNLFFGANGDADIEEASEVAKMVLNDKIEEYRAKVRERKNL